MSLVERDKKYIWHPFTQALTAPLPLPVVSGQGAYLKLSSGKEVLDGISSWWCNVHGHGNPEIASAIFEQAQKLSHVMFANFTHEPAVLLAEKLISKAPPGLRRVFYSDSGSTAVETALKMCFQYWQQTNPQKTVLVALKDGYHGDTFGAMSASDRSIFTKAFWPKLFDVVHVESACISECQDGMTQNDLTVQTLRAVDQAIAPHAEQFAGLIIEPLLQAAGGMKVWPKGFLKGLDDLCKKYNALLIVDEVMTGFYRTGRRFASLEENVSPDIMCLSKGLTGGTLPLSATLATEKIYEAFLHQKKERALLHGHTFTANPLGCAAALKSLELLNDGEEPKRIGEQFVRHRTLFDDFGKHIKNVRTKGPVFIVELNDKNTGYTATSGQEIQRYCFERGLFIRPLGNVVYFMPPYCVTNEEVSWALTLIKDAMSRKKYS